MPGRATILAYGRQGPAVLAAGADGWAMFYVFKSRLSYFPFSNASSVVRRLDILKYCGLGFSNPVVVVSYYQRRAR